MAQLDSAALSSRFTSGSGDQQQLVNHRDHDPVTTFGGWFKPPSLGLLCDVPVLVLRGKAELLFDTAEQHFVVVEPRSGMKTPILLIPARGAHAFC